MYYKPVWPKPFSAKQKHAIQSVTNALPIYPLMEEQQNQKGSQEQGSTGFSSIPDVGHLTIISQCSITSRPLVWFHTSIKYTCPHSSFSLLNTKDTDAAGLHGLEERKEGHMCHGNTCNLHNTAVRMCGMPVCLLKKTHQSAVACGVLTWGEDNGLLIVTFTGLSSTASPLSLSPLVDKTDWVDWSKILWNIWSIVHLDLGEDCLMRTIGFDCNLKVDRWLLL